MYGLVAFGAPLPAHVAACPATAAALAELEATTRRRVLTAGFSRLPPGTHIVPHRGYSNYAPYIARVHLGLVTPATTAGRDACFLVVGGERRSWTRDGVFAFDDARLHEAVNDSDTPRDVLLLDVERHVGALPPAAAAAPGFTAELQTMLADVVGSANGAL